MPKLKTHAEQSPFVSVLGNVQKCLLFFRGLGSCSYHSGTHVAMPVPRREEPLSDTCLGHLLQVPQGLGLRGSLGNPKQNPNLEPLTLISRTQRSQYPLIKEHTLNYHIKAPVI